METGSGTYAQGVVIDEKPATAKKLHPIQRNGPGEQKNEENHSNRLSATSRPASCQSKRWADRNKIIPVITIEEHSAQYKRLADMDSNNNTQVNEEYVPKKITSDVIEEYIPGKSPAKRLKSMSRRKSLVT